MNDPRVTTLDNAALTFGASIAIAESCTGGLVAARITALPGVSRWFRGSAVVYATGAKERLLRLDHEQLEEHGPVSSWAAGALAIAARERFRADIGLSVTGVAGPDPDERGVRPGIVYVGWSSVDSGEVSSFVIDASGPEGRARVRELAADVVLETAIAAIRRLRAPATRRRPRS